MHAASRQNSIIDVRFGSKADIPQCPSNVRFTPKSGHRNSAAAGPFFILDRPTSSGAFGGTAACWKRVSPRRLPVSASHARRQSLAPPATEAPSLAVPQLATSGVRSAHLQTPMRRDGRQLFLCSKPIAAVNKNVAGSPNTQPRPLPTGATRSRRLSLLSAPLRIGMNSWRRNNCAHADMGRTQKRSEVMGRLICHNRLNSLEIWWAHKELGPAD